MIHHLTLEVDKRKLTKEIEFWGILGFLPTGLRRRSRKQPPIHWLVSVEGWAIELIPKDKAHRNLDSAYHICLTFPGTMDFIIRKCFEFGIRWDESSDYFGYKRAFLHSPTGYVIEILSGSPSIKAGPPIEEN